MSFESRHFGPEVIGRARFIVHKYEKDDKAPSWERGIEILDWSAFDSGFISQRSEHGPMDMASEVISEMSQEEQLADVLKDFPYGFYEVVGDVEYEFDPGFDSPNGPAEADAWWSLINASTQPLTEKQADWWIPKPPPPEQAWEHSKRAERSDRYNTMCNGCGEFVHRCGSCSYMDWAEHNFCSENCWKHAGSPKDPNEVAA